MSGRRITIVVHKDGDPDSRSVKLSVWFVRMSLFGAMAFVLLVAMGAVLYTPIVRTAARVHIAAHKRAGKGDAEFRRAAFTPTLRFAEVEKPFHDFLGPGFHVS